MFYQLSRHPLAQSSWQIKLTSTVLLIWRMRMRFYLYSLPWKIHNFRLIMSKISSNPPSPFNKIPDQNPQNYHHNTKCLRNCHIKDQFSSAAQSCPTLCHPMDCSTPGLPAHQQLPEFTQTEFTHVHWVSDAIQSFHPLSAPSPSTFNLSQHQGLFKWVSSSHQVAKVLEFQLQHLLPVNIQDWFPLAWTGWISLQSKGLSRVFSNTTVQKL